MKILFLFPHFLSPGGAANVVLQFALALQSRGHKVQICCAKVSDEFRNTNPELHFKELNIPASNSVYYWLLFPFWQVKINRRLREYKDYVFFAHVLPSNWWAWTFKLTNRQVKIVWYCHEPSAFIHSRTWINAIPVRVLKWGAKLLNPFLRKVDILLEKRNDLVLCNSYFTKGQYEKVYKRKADKVVYPPFVLKSISPESSKGDYILTVGRLSRFKNLDKLIMAFKNVLPDLITCRLVIAGEGEEKERLEQLAVELQVQGQISFKGKVDDKQLADLYHKARVTVICSHEEPFGLVPIESMMHATPVIAHNSGGPKETIRHGVTGFLYKRETELEQFIKNVFDMDHAQYHQMQQSCLEEVVKYNVSNSVLQLEDIFKKATQQRYYHLGAEQA